jgi:hypothetical protein
MYTDKSRTCPTCKIVVYPDEVGCGCGWVPKVDGGAPGSALEQLGTVDPAAYEKAMGIEPDRGHAGIKAMRRRVTAVAVEYDGMVQPRDRKEFTSNGAARKFYREMLAQGRNPKVVSASVNGH